MCIRLQYGPQAPLVDYDSLAEFQNLYHQVCRQYQLLVSKTLYAQAVRSHKSMYAWTSAESISLGLAEFPELLENGLLVLLRLTKNRGLRFVLSINQQLIVAVTACCRTYFNTLNERCNRRFYKTHPEQDSDIDMISLQHVSTLMCQTVLDVLGPAFTWTSLMLTNDANCRISHSHMTQLYKKCFVSYAHPDTHEIMCRVPRGKIGEYFVAICSMTHPRLGEKTGAQRLCTDVLRLITDLVALD